MAKEELLRIVDAHDERDALRILVGAPEHFAAVYYDPPGGRARSVVYAPYEPHVPRGWPKLPVHRVGWRLAWLAGLEPERWEAFASTGFPLQRDAMTGVMSEGGLLFAADDRATMRAWLDAHELTADALNEAAAHRR